MYENDIDSAWREVRPDHVRLAAAAMFAADNVSTRSSPVDGGNSVVIQIAFPCATPEEANERVGFGPSESLRFRMSLETLFEKLTTKGNRFKILPWDSRNPNEFVARVTYELPSFSAIVARGDRRKFMKRLALHEVANVLADGLAGYDFKLRSNLQAKYPDPRRYLDAWLRKTFNIGDLARVYVRPQKAPLRNPEYFDR